MTKKEGDDRRKNTSINLKNTDTQEKKKSKFSQITIKFAETHSVFPKIQYKTVTSYIPLRTMMNTAFGGSE